MRACCGADNTQAGILLGDAQEKHEHCGLYRRRRAVSGRSIRTSRIPRVPVDGDVRCVDLETSRMDVQCQKTATLKSAYQRTAP
ncbi:hypothetical protein NDU88_011462 [Pleurodeles waltl]|uniref:Uncharacterized protein n=1 Tax=Pleurodeles waltl TaxID=8319 RepID=A0AAV7QXP1_PLEWA|nr:hypothetical protein NDU88_011462 [Pleurodeles waltl]